MTAGKLTLSITGGQCAFQLGRHNPLIATDIEYVIATFEDRQDFSRTAQPLNTCLAIDTNASALAAK
jgi:hypothetical protein